MRYVKTPSPKEKQQHSSSNAAAAFERACSAAPWAITNPPPSPLTPGHLHKAFIQIIRGNLVSNLRYSISPIFPAKWALLMFWCCCLQKGQGDASGSGHFCISPPLSHTPQQSPSLCCDHNMPIREHVLIAQQQPTHALSHSIYNVPVMLAVSPSITQQQYCEQKLGVAVLLAGLL